jgi:hypothetical protein
MKGSTQERAIWNLIQLGQIDCNQTVSDRILAELRPFYEVNGLSCDVWGDLTEKLIQADHESLARGLVIAEESLRWSGGSVAGAIWVFRSFEKKYPSDLNTLAEWMMAKSTNPWVPFGTNRGCACTLDELQVFRSAVARRRKAAEEASELLHELAKARKASRRRLKEMRQTIDESRTKARSTLVEELEALPVQDRLIHIALDEENELFFYRPEILDDLPYELNSVGEWALGRVKEKAAKIRKGDWFKWFSRFK